MRNMKKQSEEGMKKIVNERYDLTMGEIQQLFELAKENTEIGGLYNAVTTAFYAGVNVGHKIATAEAGQEEVSVTSDGRTVIGCQYCGVYENGDVIPDLNYLIGVREKVESLSPNVELDGDCEDGISANYIVSVCGDDLSLGFYSMNHAIHASRKIRFCPMCGRKL